MNLFGIQKMENERQNVEMITTSSIFAECGCGSECGSGSSSREVVEHEEERGGGKVLAGPERQERKEWEPRMVGKELRVLAWAVSLGQGHPDFGFFRGGECKKCAGCSDEFNLLHYTSEKNAYCVRCYLDGFCDVVEDDTIFLVVIRKSARILIEILNPNE